MVDWELSTIIPLVSNVATALGVCLAATYYVLNLRVQQNNMKLTLENRRMALVRELSKDMQNMDWLQSYFEQLHYEWKDYDDFERKYGTESNLEAASKRISMWMMFNSRGAMLRNGVLGIKDLYDSVGFGVIWMWEKYKPIIEENRRRYSGQHYLRDFEYYAGEMAKFVMSLDPSFKVPDTFDKYVQNN